MTSCTPSRWRSAASPPPEPARPRSSTSSWSWPASRLRPPRPPRPLGASRCGAAAAAAPTIPTGADTAGAGPRIGQPRAVGARPSARRPDEAGAVTRPRATRPPPQRSDRGRRRRRAPMRPTGPDERAEGAESPGDEGPAPRPVTRLAARPGRRGQRPGQRGEPGQRPEPGPDHGTQPGRPEPKASRATAVVVAAAATATTASGPRVRRPGRARPMPISPSRVSPSRSRACSTCATRATASCAWPATCRARTTSTSRSSRCASSRLRKGDQVTGAARPAGTQREEPGHAAHRRGQRRRSRGGSPALPGSRTSRPCSPTTGCGSRCPASPTT